MWRVVFSILILSIFAILFSRGANVFSASLSEVLIDDMSKPNEAKLHGVPDDWSWNVGPTLIGNEIPSQYNAIQGWGHMYEAAVGNTSTNTRVQLRNMEVWWLTKSTGKWKRVQSSPNNVEGAAFRENYAGNASQEPDIKIIEGLQAIRPGNGHNFHFWHPGGGYDIPSADRNDFGGVVTSFQARLVLDNPGAADDRDRAKYLISSALDLYFSVANHGTPPIPGLGVGRAKYVTREWTLFSFNSISKSNPGLIRDNPPPIEMPGGAGPTNPPTGTCPKKNQGDADCNGSITLADYSRWKQEFRAVVSTKTADFNNDSTVSLADYTVWKTTFKGGE